MEARHREPPAGHDKIYAASAGRALFVQVALPERSVVVEERDPRVDLDCRLVALDGHEMVGSPAGLRIFDGEGRGRPGDAIDFLARMPRKSLTSHTRDERAERGEDAYTGQAPIHHLRGMPRERLSGARLQDDLVWMARAPSRVFVKRQRQTLEKMHTDH